MAASIASAGGTPAPTATSSAPFVPATPTMGGDDGFVYALQKIDEQHLLNTAQELAGLQSYTTLVELLPGDVLVREADSGLFFVETGLLRVQWTAGNSTRASP